MFDYCAWLSAEPLADSDHQLRLEAMRPAAAQAAPTRCLLPNAGAGAFGPDISLAEADGQIALIAGRPRFAAAPERDAPDDGMAPAARLLRLWRAHGRAAPTRIAGDFALALIDTRVPELFVAIDRIGIQTLAFATRGKELALSNRADAVARHPALRAALAPQALFQYFYFFDVPAPDTIFQGVEKLLPGQWLHWRAGALERGFYWHLRYRDEPRRDFDAQKQRFFGLLRDCVGRAKGTDAAAAFLSGGTDSSTVAGILTEVQGQPARTYSIGFDAEGFDEMDYARLAARHFGLDAREYYLRPDDVLATLATVATHYDEPFANESAVPAYFCAKMAAEDGYPVLLGGDGGDEIFGGNARYAHQRVFELYGRVPRALRAGLIEPLVALPAVGRTGLGRKAQSYIRQARIPLPERMESYNYIYRQPLDAMFDAEFLAAVDVGRPAALLDEAYRRAASASYINRMLHLDLKFTLADNDLRKVSRMVEAAGIEVRYPLLDDAMVEFSGEVPPDWKVKRLYLRWFFRKALTGYLPDAIVNKSKHGFGLPFGLWLRDHAPLRERVNDRLADLGRRGWLRPNYIGRMQREHQSGHATYFGKMLWVMLTLEEWLDAQGASRSGGG